MSSSATSSSEKLLVTLDKGIKRITINRPDRRNSLDSETTQLLFAAIDASASDDSRVIVLTGTGNAFCAGADLQSVNERDIRSFDVTASLRRHTNPTIRAMRSLPKPIIARVHGPAVGVGCNYALACDLILASEEATFGQVFIRIGLMPDGGSTYFLPRLVGYAKAFELMATGDILTAQEALSLGLINRVVPAEKLETTVNAMAERLAAAPSLALARIKAGLNHGERSDLASALDYEAVHQDECFHSEDFLEGVKAFIEKRKPEFHGK
jgi:2-(1,2-epoxy-1,2-dihydrophenyl)acetyl-CoA isomerase